MEAGELGLYLIAACAFTTLLQHPASPIRHFVQSEIARRALMGLAMGATVIGIVISPWGRQSGGHFNPAITLAFYRLGRVEPWDAVFYVSAQFLGATGGVAIARYFLRGAAANHAVRYAITAPGMYGALVAFVAELAISFSLMLTVLIVTNDERIAPYTALVLGAMIATYITLESPLSGMSTNPARTFGSAFQAGYWHALWIYFAAPTFGMLAAAELFLRIRSGRPPSCAKLHHANGKRCIFNHDVPLNGPPTL